MNLINGTAGADFLAGLLKEMNEIHGFEEGDTLVGGHLADVLVGGGGEDFLWGDSGNDTLEAGAGYDVVFGSDGDDHITGGTESDYISGGKDNDVIEANEGFDVVDGNSGDDRISGGDDMDYLYGSAGNDTLDGGEGDDFVSGGSGDDVLIASRGGDSYIGGSGFDTIDFTHVLGHISLDLSKHTGTIKGESTSFGISVDGIEKVVLGQDGGNVMGTADSEVFVGGAGEDWFRGKGGADVYTGGEGKDVFSWLKKDVADGMGVDRITDFEVGVDVLELSDFAKSGQAWGSVVRISQTDDGVLVEGKVKGGEWMDVVVLEGVDINSVGADHHHMTIADLGLF